MHKALWQKHRRGPDRNQAKRGACNEVKVGQCLNQSINPPGVSAPPPLWTGSAPWLVAFHSLEEPLSHDHSTPAQIAVAAAVSLEQVVVAKLPDSLTSAGASALARYWWKRFH